MAQSATGDALIRAVDDFLPRPAIRPQGMNEADGDRYADQQSEAQALVAVTAVAACKGDRRERQHTGSGDETRVRGHRRLTVVLDGGRHLRHVSRVDRLRHVAEVGDLAWADE